MLIPRYLKFIEYLLQADKYPCLDSHTKRLIEKVVGNATESKDLKNIDDIRSMKYIKISSLKILKSILFMGYSIPNMKIVGMPSKQGDKQA
mmetsp:Transcript_6626/g.5962  ORF Transcript_6626/g.5962 Transcript_6626/m.5962 type:complete len:91 (-) Transcript_6626:913-1185(-)